MQRLTRAIGTADLGAINLQAMPAIRAAAVAGKLDDLAYRLDAAAYFAAAIGFDASLALIRDKQRELTDLRAEVARVPGRASLTPAMAIADPGKGKPGRSAAIIAWIRSTGVRREISVGISSNSMDGANAHAVAERFGLALSTAQAYVRRSRKTVCRTS